MMRISVWLALASATVSAQTAPPKYTGPGSCASPSCHGAVQPHAETAVQQNEYATWVIKDKHARAAAVLTNPVATRMAKLLGLERADTAPRCLACHSLDAPEDQRARTFDYSDGVSCEACHGPASNWLGSHTTRDKNAGPAGRDRVYAESVSVGMRDLRDPVSRAENCLTCHLGSPQKFVDHQMIAAGHPDLYFELASFSAAMPRHWKEPVDQDPWVEVRTLAVAQAVQLQEQIKRLERNVSANPRTDYADLDCFACHHSLTNAENSWQQERGYPGRKAGNPPWNLSRYVVLRQVVSEVDRGDSSQLEAEINKLYDMVTAQSSDRGQVVSQANATAELAGRIVQKVSAATFDQARTLRLLKGISGDAVYISQQGERAAEQTAMALQSLYSAYAAQARPRNDTQIQTGIQGLFQQVENASAYNAFKFADQMRAVNGLLP
jgi:hypothetical protein